MFNPRFLRSLWVVFAVLNLLVLFFAVTVCPKEELATIFLAIAATAGLVGYVKLIFLPIEEDTVLIKWSYFFYLLYIINASIIIL